MNSPAREKWTYGQCNLASLLGRENSVNYTYIKIEGIHGQNYRNLW